MNSRARGGTGDAERTPRLCRELLADREPLVIKALSWALRELAKRDPASVRRFLATYDASLPSLVRREVRATLLKGRKARPRRHRRAANGGNA